jgi:hypothetical protein
MARQRLLEGIGVSEAHQFRKAGARFGVGRQQVCLVSELQLQAVFGGAQEDVGVLQGAGFVGGEDAGVLEALQGVQRGGRAQAR